MRHVAMFNRTVLMSLILLEIIVFSSCVRIESGSQSHPFVVFGNPQEYGVT